MTILGKTASPSALALQAKLGDSTLRVRWGGAIAPGAVQGEVHLLSAVEQLASLRAAGVACPDYTTTYEIALKWAEEGHRVLGRNFYHSQGSDIIPYWKGKEWPTRGASRRFAQKDFWVKAVQMITHEWRVHVMRSKASGNYYSIGIGQKVHISSPRPSALQAGFTIRSRRLGWHLDHTTALPGSLRTLAKQAVAAVKYDFGAVDLLQLMDGTGVVLEVNSCPALRDEYTLDRYARALQKYYGPKKEG